MEKKTTGIKNTSTRRSAIRWVDRIPVNLQVLLKTFPKKIQVAGIGTCLKAKSLPFTLTIRIAVTKRYRCRKGVNKYYTIALTIETTAAISRNKPHINTSALKMNKPPRNKREKNDLIWLMIHCTDSGKRSFSESNRTGKIQKSIK